LLILDSVPPGKNVARVGEDVAAGSMVLAAGRVLRPQDVGLISSIGQAEVEVVRQPRVRIVVTGNELLAAGTPPTGAQIADANGPMLAALVARDGGLRIEVRDQKSEVSTQSLTSDLRPLTSDLTPDD